LICCQRGSGESEGEFWFGRGGEDFSGEIQAAGIGGEQDAGRCDDFSALATQRDVDSNGISRVDACNLGAFCNDGTGTDGGASEAVDDFAWIDCAARDFLNDADAAGIVPIDWRILKRFYSLAVHRVRTAGNFPDTGKFQIGTDAEFTKNFSIAFENVSEAGQIAGGGFAEDHAAGAAAGAVADSFCFEKEDGFFGREALCNGCGS